MEKELCFIIEGTELYLEQVLVDYNEIPVFYICCSDKGLYLVLCTDIDKQKFYVGKVNLLTISDLFEKDITMREAFLRGKSYWEVDAADQVDDDLVRSICKEQIWTEYLPKEGAFFNVFSEELKEYKKNIQEKLFGGNDWKHVADNMTNIFEELLLTNEPLNGIYSNIPSNMAKALIELQMDKYTDKFKEILYQLKSQNDG